MEPMTFLLVRIPLLVATAAALAASAAATPLVPRGTSGSGSCSVFPADNYWHADVSGLPVERRSATWLSHMSPGSDLHPDFGPSYGDGPPYGIPVTTVGADHRRVHVRFRYADESDPVRYPLGKDTRIEGGPRSSGDRHAIVVDVDRCRLYETWDTHVRDGHWRAGSGATWSLDDNALRPDGWTSADAAGLPILPGLLRWREVRDGTLDHAVRLTTDLTSSGHLWPARHDAGSKNSDSYPPMGARFRLKSSFDESGYSERARTVLDAFKRYGLVLADNGSPWYFQGEQNRHWPSHLVEELKSVPASAFEAVDTSSLMVDPDSAQVRQP